MLFPSEASTVDEAIHKYEVSPDALTTHDGCLNPPRHHSPAVPTASTSESTVSALKAIRRKRRIRHSLLSESSRTPDSGQAWRGGRSCTGDTLMGLSSVLAGRAEALTRLAGTTRIRSPAKVGRSMN